MSTVPELLQNALHFHHTGLLPQAESLYRQVLQADPGNADVCDLLGVLVHQLGRTDEACALLRNAVALRPGAVDFHYHLGVVLHSRGDFAEARTAFQQVVLLDPGHVEGHLNLGNAYMNQGQPGPASTCYREATRLDPRHAYAHYNLACALRDLGAPDEAVSSYWHALALDPANPYAHYELGLILKQLGQAEQATECFRQTLVRQPLHADALINLGLLLSDQQRVEEAIACFRKALQVNPMHTEVHNTLGVTYIQLGQHADAAECFQQVLRINPNHASAGNNLANALMAQKRLAEAAVCFDRVLAADPQNSLALYNRALLRLLEGDFARGWPDFEHRWAQAGVMPRAWREPHWDGSALVGKTILVYPEQGFGDTLQFVRYLPLVKARGGRVVLQCQPDLFRLLRGFEGVDQLVVAGGALPVFDVQVPLLSLPGVFGATPEGIANEAPYLHVEDGLQQKWHTEFAALAGLKIGFVWQGNPKVSGDRLRSLPLRHYEKLAGIPGVCLVSLQKKAGREQLRSWRGRLPVLDLGERLVDFAETAAVLKNLDLVISTCTSVCHLAGALGVSVWTALQFIPDWRWQLDRSDSPWYPTMRLFRQPRPGDWGAVFEEMAQALKELVTNE